MNFVKERTQKRLKSVIVYKKINRIKSINIKKSKKEINERKKRQKSRIIRENAQNTNKI